LITAFLNQISTVAAGEIDRRAPLTKIKLPSDPTASSFKPKMPGREDPVRALMRKPKMRPDR